MNLHCNGTRQSGFKKAVTGFEQKVNVLSDLLYAVRNRKMLGRISFGPVSISTVLNHFRNYMATPGLTRREVKQIRAYYAPYKVSTLSHRKIKAVTGRFSPAYLPEEMFYGYIDPYFNNRSRAKGLENKALFDRLYPGIPMPKTLACRINGYWLSPDYQVLTLDEVLSLANAEEAVFVKKADNSYGGLGVVKASRSANASTGEALSKALSELTGDIILQMSVRQHAGLAKFNPSSVNTYRIATLLTAEGKVRVVMAMLRVGVGDKAVDNFSSGGIVVGIDPHGRLRSTGYDMKGNSTTEHPLTGICYAGASLPSFDRAVKLAKRAHPMLPDFRLVFWDITVAEDGEPQLIEANLIAGGIDSLQWVNGPFFGRMTRAIVREALADSDFPGASENRRKRR